MMVESTPGVADQLEAECWSDAEDSWNEPLRGCPLADSEGGKTPHLLSRFGVQG